MYKSIFRAAAIAAVLGLAAAPAAYAQSATDAAFRATTLSLSAEGETLASPDMATINIGVQSEAPTAQAAMSANSAKMNAVVAAIRAAGVAERDIQTSGLNLNPQYVYEPNQSPRLTGYQASNTVTIRLRDLARVGPVVDATVSSGANTINGITFGLQNPDAAENSAREDAVKALTAKAELYARATGYRISRLVSLSESGGYTPSPPVPMMARAVAMDAGGSTPVAGGELSVRMNVSATYELTR